MKRPTRAKRSAPSERTFAACLAPRSLPSPTTRRRIATGTTWVTVDGRDVAYTPENLEDLALAYACTIHKSQGSEFPAIVIVLTSAHHVLLDRALLYTAITRAKRLAVLIGDDRAITRAAAHAESTRARSRLAERIRRAAMQGAMARP